LHQGQLKNRTLLESCYLPGDLEAKIDGRADHYYRRRSYENLANFTPADVAFERAEKSCWNEKESNATQSEIAVCSIDRTPQKKLAAGRAASPTNSRHPLPKILWRRTRATTHAIEDDVEIEVTK
jgi:hypothetical protein